MGYTFALDSDFSEDLPNRQAGLMNLSSSMPLVSEHVAQKILADFSPCEILILHTLQPAN